MKIRSLLRAAVLLGSLAACSTIHTQTGKDPQADFTRYKTYSWVARPSVAREKPNASVLEQTVESQVDHVLAARGMTRMEAKPESSPDLLISYSATTQNNIEYGLPRFGTATEQQMYLVRRGNLTLQFLDPKSRRVVWEGTATDVLGDSGATQDQVAEAVQKLMEKYPTATG